MVNGGFISPFKTTLRCHRGRTSCSRGRRMVILRMTFWRVVSWSVVGGFNSLSTLDIEALWTRMVFTFLFKEKRCTRYSANVKKDRSFGWRPFSLAHIAKAFQWEFYTRLDESRRGSAAISTTVSGILWLFKISRIRATRPDPTVWDLCGIEAVGGWVHTGIVEHRSGESWDVCSIGAIEDATVVMGVEMLSEWPWCLGISVSSGSSWALWGPGERRKSGPNRPKIGTGRLPPMLCRRGREKRRWASLCSPLLRTYRSGESRRHKTVCLRLLVEDAIPLGWADWDETEHRRWHSGLREDVWVWELSCTDPVIGEVLESCETELWNEFRLVSECTPPLYCCRSIPGLSDGSIVGPSGEGLDEWLLIPANWCGVWIPVVTKLRKSVVSANWLPSPWEMHLWRRRDWGPVDVTGHPSSRRDGGTNGDMRGTPNRAWLECPMTDDVESIGPWTRVGGNVDGDGHWL